MPEGSLVLHFGRKIHYEGSQDGEVILQMAGDGPATATAAEQN
jgi:hypothetical protein